VRRLLGVIPVLLVVSFLAFSLVQLVPGDPAVVAAGDNASAELIEQTRERLGLDQPFFTQYAQWLGNLVTGDLGTSLFSSQPTWDSIVDRIPVTASLAILSLVWALVIGLTLGIAAGLRPGSWVDRGTTALATLGISMPSFWVGLLLVSLFSLRNPLFPATGYAPLSEGIGPWLSHLFLPSIALGAATAAEVARQARAGVLQVMEQDYIRTAEAKGLRRRVVVGKHALKNAAIPVVTVFGLQAAHLIGGAIVVEQVFGIPGLGTLALNSIIQRDFPLLQAFIIVTTVFVLVVNLLVDLSYGLFNPRVRQA
jgi:peptide/nickel transport system permease protein